MLSYARFNRIYRLSAWYDLLVAWPYATPLTLYWLWGAVNGVHGALGLPPLPPFTPLGGLFGNFFGTVVVIWSVVRLRQSGPDLARYDAVGRWLFSLWMLIALAQGGPVLLWGFVVIEMGFGLLQSLPYRNRDQQA